MTVRSLLRAPTAFLPLVLSGAALALLVGYVTLVGVGPTPQPDEGTPARIFQLLMAMQLPIIASFATEWLPRALRAALLVLLLHVAVAAVPVVAVIALEL